MTGGEIVVAGKAVEAVGRKALGQDDKVKDTLLQAAGDTSEMAAAARTMAARIAVKERIKLKLYQPFARMLGGLCKSLLEEVQTGCGSERRLEGLKRPPIVGE
jgi:hypothetical protein